MVTLAQRIEALRTEANLSRPALAAALHFPKGALEKFETGRQTPTKEQQAKIAAYFGVSLFYLRGESNDRTRQEDWMDMDAGEKGFAPAPAAAPKTPKSTEAPQATLLDTFLAGKQAQDTLRTMALEVLKSPEGQEIITKAVKKELARRGL